MLKMKRRYILYVGIMLLLIMFGFVLGKTKWDKHITTDNSFAELSNDMMLQEKISMQESIKDEDKYINDDFTVNDKFATHLPLVIIDLNDGKIPEDYEYNSETDSFEISDGTDPYLTAHMKIINNDDKANSINDKEEISSKIKVKYRGNTSMTYAKKQYAIKLLDDNGNQYKQSLLGMESDEDWILNISMSDPSLIRNYLALNIGGQVMGETPDVRYCELIVKNGDKYEYKGLYLMMESVKKSEGRVDISSYESGKEYSSYLLRRDRFKDSRMILNTDASLNEQCYGWLEIKYPGEKYMHDKLYDYILNDVNKIEQIIYSDDHKIFNTYSNYIDLDSFVDYFLINEFFMNYDAGNNSTYMYKEIGSKLKIGPFWDFDLAVDNYGKELTNLNNIAFVNQAWFERLVNSEKFTKRLIERYKELRNDILSYDSIEKNIDKTVSYLGNAIERDYTRWQEEYENLNYRKLKDHNGITVDRNFISFENEINKVKDNLRIHGTSMEYSLEDLNYKNKSDYGRSSYTGLAAMFLLSFLCSVIIVRRRYS